MRASVSDQQFDAGEDVTFVEFLDNSLHCVHYLQRLFQREPDFRVASVNYDFAKLLARAEEPR